MHRLIVSETVAWCNGNNVPFTPHSVRMSYFHELSTLNYQQVHSMLHFGTIRKRKTRFYNNMRAWLINLVRVLQARVCVRFLSTIMPCSNEN